MIQPTIRPALASSTRLITAADLANLPTDHPSGPVAYELDNGNLIMMVPPGNVHGAVQLNLGTQLKIQGEGRGFGKARTEVGVVLWRNPTGWWAPTSAFIATRSLPIRESVEGYLETIPDLVIEVQSQSDTAAYMQRKVDDCLTAGVERVWIADPSALRVIEYRAGMPSKDYGSQDILTLDGLIPGFQFSVAAAFQL